MRIAFDLSPAVHHHAGVGRYAQELLTALLGENGAHEYCTFYYDPRGDARSDPPLDRLPAQVIRSGAKPWRMSVLLAYGTGATMDRWLPPAEVLHATDHLLPPVHRARTVFTIYDLTTQLYPEYHSALNRWYSALMLPRFLRRADAVIAISESTQRDIVQRLNVPPEKIRVIYAGVHPRFQPDLEPSRVAAVRAKYQLPERMMLYLGTVEPRKNLEMLVEAYHALLQHTPAAPTLVIAGRKGWMYQPVFDRVRALGLDTRVHFTGWVDDADMPALLNAAEVFVYPSLYEGFGLPPLEAMACGVPVLCSNTSSLPEVVGDAGLLLDPRDAGAWTHALARVLDDEHVRAELRARGLAQASKFSWSQAARQTVQVYDQLKREN